MLFNEFKSPLETINAKTEVIAWVRELLNPNTKQAQGSLCKLDENKNSIGECCLGVRARLRGLPVVINTPSLCLVYSFEGGGTSATGLRDDPIIDVGSSSYLDLMRMNDNYKSFTFIAGFILGCWNTQYPRVSIDPNEL